MSLNWHFGSNPSVEQDAVNRAAHEARSMIKMKNIILCILIFVLMISGCEGKQKNNVYHATKFDSLSFLIEKSDLIVLVNISDGMPPNDKPATEFKLCQKELTFKVS